MHDEFHSKCAPPRAAVNQVPTLERLALQTTRKNIHRLDSMCRAYAKSAVACGRFVAGADHGAACTAMIAVPISIIEDILVAAAASKLANSLRSLARVNPTIGTDQAFEKYWQQAVERYRNGSTYQCQSLSHITPRYTSDYAVRPIPGPFNASVESFKEQLRALDRPEDNDVDRSLIGRRGHLDD